MISRTGGRIFHHSDYNKENMEKPLSRKELFNGLLDKVQNPFTSDEQKNDIKRILLSSSSFHGRNHLFLVECYLHPDNPYFYISKEEAIRQAELAIKEKNFRGHFYLHLLYQDIDEVKSRNHLRRACVYQVGAAYLRRGYLLHEGILFEKNRKLAYECFLQASYHHEKDGYFGRLVRKSEEGDLKGQKEIIRKAEEEGFSLPGYIE